MESFQTHIASFYEALAEEKLDQLADALHSLRICVQAGEESNPEKEVFQEVYALYASM